MAISGAARAKRLNGLQRRRDRPQRHREHRDSYVLLCVLCASVADLSVPSRPMPFTRPAKHTKATTTRCPQSDAGRPISGRNELRLSGRLHYQDSLGIGPGIARAPVTTKRGMAMKRLVRGDPRAARDACRSCGDVSQRVTSSSRPWPFRPGAQGRKCRSPASFRVHL
jgi:hypothetical protein